MPEAIAEDEEEALLDKNNHLSLALPAHRHPAAVLALPLQPRGGRNKANNEQEGFRTSNE